MEGLSWGEGPPPLSPLKILQQHAHSICTLHIVGLVTWRRGGGVGREKTKELQIDVGGGVHVGGGGAKEECEEERKPINPFPIFLLSHIHAETLPEVRPIPK
jgi:hypothetical protein